MSLGNADDTLHFISRTGRCRPAQNGVSHASDQGALLDGNRTDTRLWSPSTSTECPVGLAEQAWIEASMHWFAGQFGAETALRDVVLPNAEFLPDAYTGTPEQIEVMVARVYDLMSVDPSQQLLVSLFGASDDEAAKKSSRAVGHYHKENGRAVIGSDLREPQIPPSWRRSSRTNCAMSGCSVRTASRPPAKTTSASPICSRSTSASASSPPTPH